MTELSTSSDTGAPPHVAASSHPFSRWTSGRGAKHPPGTTPPAHLTASLTGVAGGSHQSRAEAAFESWLTSDDKPDVWQVDVRDEPHTSLTGMLGELVTSGRQLSADAATELGMPPGTTQGHAATELLLAVNDTAGPRCRSYRAALSYLRDHDDAVVGR